jgi:hypothetical protein
MKPASSTGPFFEVPGHTGPTGGGTIIASSGQNLAKAAFERSELQTDKAFFHIIGAMVAKAGGEVFIPLNELLTDYRVERIDEVDGIRFKARKAEAE